MMKESPFTIPEKLLRQSGDGSLVQYELFPGIELSENHLKSRRIAMRHDELPDILEVNYCGRGRIGWNLKGGFSVFLGPGDLEIHTMDCCADSAMSLPLGYYEGITVLFDLKKLEHCVPPLISDIRIDGNALLGKLCPQGQPLSLPANEETGRIFSGLYSLPEQMKLPYYRLKALELLLYFIRLEPEREEHLCKYRSQQTELIKEIHGILTQNLDRRFTIEELSKKYLINTSTLKAVFKAVYSQPIAAYMKGYRIRQAMELLRGTDGSIGEVARQVGYGNQGKFTKTFKEYIGMLPTEYREQAMKLSRKV